MKTLISLFSIVLCLFYGKAQWVELDPGVDDALFDIYAITPDIVVAVGANGTIIKTTDGGETWQQKDSGTTENLRKVQFPIQDIGYIVGDSGIVLKTTDSGETWAILNTGQTSDFYGLSCLDESTIFISNNDTLLKSEDGGSTWLSIGIFPGGGVQFLSEEIGFSQGFSNSFYKTLNGGLNWLELDWWSPFHFLDENIGFIYSSGLIKTIDGGINFEWVTGEGGGELRDIYAIDENNVWGIIDGTLGGDGSSQGVTKITSSDSENYVEIIAWDDETQDMWAVHFADEFTGYIVGYKYGEATIWKNGTGINTMSTTDETLKDEIKIYPNPVSNEINIEIEKGNLQDYMVSLTDMAGKQIYSKSFKEKKIKINTSHFQKGIYILSIETKNKKHSQKLIVN